MSNLSNRKRRKLAGKARDAANALTAFADELERDDHSLDTLAYAAARIKTFELPKHSSAPPQPETYSADEAWEKMEQGWVVSPSDGVTRWHMQTGGLAFGERDDSDTNRHQTRDDWNVNAASLRFTLHGIHPRAHEYALQRLKAAGLKVGSVVEVVREAADKEGGWPTYWDDAMSTGWKTVKIIHPGYIFLDNNYTYPAHYIKLVEAAPKTWKPGDKAWVEVTVVTPNANSRGDCAVDIIGGDNGGWVKPSALRETPGGGE